ncbi:MAG: hypothetical protein IJ893_02335 [Bacteroidales bacterium]|nr:hypothetical protein [Bacteroidales bacterium]
MKGIRIYIAGLLTGMTLLVTAGCKIDNRFDLNNLDTESTVMKGAVFKLGSLKPVYLRDFLKLDGEYIVTDERGDYRVRFSTDSFPFYVYGPPVSGQDLTYEFEPLAYEMADLAGMLSDSGQGLVAELPELEIAIKVDSGVPAVFSFDAVMETARGSKTLHQYALDDLPVSYGKSEFILNATGTGARNDVIYKQIQDIDKILYPVPDALKINDLTVSIDKDQLALLEPGTEYEVSGQASVDTPLSFTADSRLDLSIPIDNAKMDLDVVGLKKAVLKMNATSTIPLDFSASVQALDGNGNVIPDISAKTDVPIAGGSVAAPVKTEVSVTLTTGGDLRFDGLVLRLSAASNPQVAGIHLNQSQGLEFKDLVLSLPDGIQVKMDLN